MKSIGTKFLVAVGIFVILFSFFILYDAWSHSNDHLEKLLNNQTELALEFDLAIRNYVAEHIRPFAQQQVEKDVFIPEAMSTSFVARSIFEKVRKKFPDYIIKFSSDNPRNPSNQANSEELEIIKFFNKNSRTQKWCGEIAIDGKKYIARYSARRMTESCLQCHGQPEDAPESLLARYGNEAGFQRPLGEVIALDAIAIPIDKYKNEMAVHLARQSSFILLGLLLLFFAIYLVFRIFISERLSCISRHFIEAAAQINELSIKPIEYKGNDEIGLLALSFNTLTKKLKNFYDSMENRVAERTRDLETTNLELTREIQERIQTEERLRESEHKFRYMFDNMSSGVAVYETVDEGNSFIFVDFNKAGEISENIQREDVIGKSVVDCFPGVKEFGLFETLKRVWQTGQPEQFPLAFYKDNRVAGWRENYVYRLPSGQVVAIFDDVTEQKQAEIQLQESEKRYRSLIDNLPVGLYRNTPGLKGKFITANQAIAYMFGYNSAEEIIQVPVADLYADHDDRKKFSDKLVQEGKIVAEELHLRKKDGTYIWGAVTASVVRDETGNIKYFDGMIEDITERKEAEEALIQAKLEAETVREEVERINKQLENSMAEANLMAIEAQAANEAKSRFLANMSHEIRTPMNAIIGFSDILAQAEMTPEHKEYVNIIRDAGHNLLKLINDILDFSRIESGKLDIEVIEFDLKKFILGIMPLMEPEAQKKGLEFKVFTSEQLPDSIKTDPHRLRQCLINIINNAIKFTEAGHVYLKVDLDQCNETHFIRFDIEDTGIGIKPDKQKMIFESFSQEDGSTTRKYGGTGLGLAITKSLIDILGGAILLESQPDKGSIFSLLIPLNAEKVKPQPYDSEQNHTQENSISADRSQTNAVRFLVVEDNVSNQRLIKTILENIGIRVSIVNNGMEAIEKAKSEKYNLIIMDMQMPRMNGYDATRTLRNEGLSLPIIALTANALKGDDEKCLKAGCNEYISKPFDKNDLYKICEKYLPSLFSTPS
ncbi:MAG: DUF3365 domain-containing protein [Sedimentisphaerales bacterium]|nr:DUF3365 domain-containing protein [Sedimentisphaerales bacterium]